jgi:TetR/AcrR family transcriptional regulator, transcriptional repressor of bet genes
MTTTVNAGPRYRRYTSEQRRAMLIEAGLVCLSRGGMAEFTVDNICKEADASRGLITHHFKSKDALLAAVYAACYSRLLGLLEPAGNETNDLVTLVDKVVSADLLGREALNAWLALWGEVANNPGLQVEHQVYYAAYRDRVSGAIRTMAQTRNKTVDAGMLAIMFISLVDGLWLERCIDPDVLSDNQAREACFQLLEAFLGPLERP